MNPFGEIFELHGLTNRSRRQWLRERFGRLDRLMSRCVANGFFSGFGNVPGIGSTVETYESAPTWARHSSLLWAPAQISSAAVDPTNTPTTTLRPGLVMGVITASGLWTNYSATATDGSQVAQGILGIGLPMLDPFTSTTQTKVWGMIVAGPLQAAKLIGLDAQARADLANRVIFDDNYLGNALFPVQKFVTKTADYTVLATDNLTSFDNLGAVGAVNFTLPTLANGLCYNFRCRADQNLTVTAAVANTMEALNNLTASSVAFSSGGARIGGEFQIFSNPGATKWLVRTLSAGAATVTVA
jgi:hypothetical protein